MDLTDAQWAVLEPLLPKGKKPGRPPKWSKRQLLDGVRWRCRVGSPWRVCRRSTGPGRPWTAWFGAGSGTFDKLAVRYEATVQVAAINIWLRCLERGL